MSHSCLELLLPQECGKQQREKEREREKERMSEREGETVTEYAQLKE